MPRILWILLCSACLAGPVWGQSLGADLLVTASDGQCTYRIDGQSRQDAFSVRPRQAIRIRGAGGMRIDVSIEPDSEAGVAGTQGPASVSLTRFTPIVRLTAREAVGRTTTHPVRIRCCTQAASSGQCATWQDASAASAAASPVRPGPFRLATLSTDPPPASGPVMRVREE